MHFVFTYIFDLLLTEKLKAKEKNFETYASMIS